MTGTHFRIFGAPMERKMNDEDDSTIVFVRADTLLDPNAIELGDHIVHFGWEEYRPMLLRYVHESASVTPLCLDGIIDWTISERKRCVGTFEEDGYHRCPEGMPVNRFDQCSRCSRTWIGRQDCVFEPQCHGDLCDSPICRREHTVYLAFFGEMGKVGMTTSRRLKERGIEQGADAIVALARFPDRLEARKAENYTSEQLRLTQSIRRRKALDLLWNSPDPARLEVLYQQFQEALRTRMTVLAEPIQLLDGYPLSKKEGTKVVLRDSHGRHQGRSMGLKGKFLVYEDANGPLYAMDVTDLSGRFITAK